MRKQILMIAGVAACMFFMILAPCIHADFYYDFKADDMVLTLTNGVWRGTAHIADPKDDLGFPVADVMINGHTYVSIDDIQLSASFFKFTAISLDGGDPLTFINNEGAFGSYMMGVTGTPFSGTIGSTIENTWTYWAYANNDPVLDIAGGASFFWVPPQQTFTVNGAGYLVPNVDDRLLMKSPNDAPPVPEPATVIGLLASACMLGIRRVFKRK
jgi:hypothetical protein